MIVNLSDILKARVLHAPVTGEHYVVVYKGDEVVRVAMDVDVTPNVFGLKSSNGCFVTNCRHMSRLRRAAKGGRSEVRA